MSRVPPTGQDITAGLLSTQHPEPRPSQRAGRRFQKKILVACILMGLSAGLGLVITKRDSLLSTVTLSEGHALCSRKDGDVNKQPPLWLQMVQSSTTNVALHLAIAKKSLNAPVTAFDVMTTGMVSIFLAYQTYINIAHEPYFFILWLLSLASFFCIARIIICFLPKGPCHDIVGDGLNAVRSYIVPPGLSLVCTIPLTLSAYFATKRLLAGFGIVWTYNCGSLAWSHSASLFPTVFQAVTTLFCWGSLSHGRMWLNMPFFVLNLIQVPPLIGVIISHTIPGALIFFIPLTCLLCLGIGIILLIAFKIQNKPWTEASSFFFDHSDNLPICWCQHSPDDSILGSCVFNSLFSILCFIASVPFFIRSFLEKQVRFEETKSEKISVNYSCRPPGTVKIEKITTCQYWLPLETKMMLVPLVAFVQFTGEAMCRFYQSQTWVQSLYATWVERTWPQYFQYLESTTEAKLHFVLEFVSGG